MKRAECCISIGRVSRTLFWYIFRDLLKIFFMASGALAGILSFGGLLRPLTQEGLDASQIGQMLTYFTPAMTTYSLPVAALFATTVVYGRLSADNELTACRAGGISNLWISSPAVVLGLVVAIMSSLFLLFIVPVYTYKVEKVVYSNLAKIVANRIERTHQFRLDRITVFAQGAYLPATSLPGEQIVVLQSPTITTFDRPDKSNPRYLVAKEFYVASDATISISQTDADEAVKMTVALRSGSKFAREFGGGTQGGVKETQFGPIMRESPIHEDVKFMNVWQLQRLYANPDESRRIRATVDRFRSQEQMFKYLHGVRDALNSAQRRAVFASGDERYVLELDGAVSALEKNGALLVNSDPTNPARHVHLHREGVGQTLNLEGKEIRMTADANSQSQLMDLNLELYDVMMQTKDGPVPRKMIPYTIKTPMPADVVALGSHKAEYYLSPAAAGTGNQEKLRREHMVLQNDIRSESHSRASFAISCFILVLLGCALGMMFKSGNFLTAFAVSFIPALLSITLIIAGQRTCGSIPADFPKHGNPIQLGLGLIWSGNVINLVIAFVLLGRLQRQ